MGYVDGPSGLSEGETYYYRVAVYCEDRDETSDWTEEESVSIPDSGGSQEAREATDT